MNFAAKSDSIKIAPPLSIKPPWVKPILLNKPPGAYSIIYGIVSQVFFSLLMH